ncbi:MAG: hypothetical protein LBM60_02395 [Clostridium sp.]|nr:hypothetical protein [Clostridium sp.]
MTKQKHTYFMHWLLKAMLTLVVALMLTLVIKTTVSAEALVQSSTGLFIYTGDRHSLYLGDSDANGNAALNGGYYAWDEETTV